MKLCEYYNCDNSDESHELDNYGTDSHPVWVCSQCSDKYDSGDTGYCSQDCKLGYGCDGSC